MFDVQVNSTYTFLHIKIYEISHWIVFGHYIFYININIDRVINLPKKNQLFTHFARYCEFSNKSNAIC